MKNFAILIIASSVVLVSSKADKSQRQQKADASKGEKSTPISEIARDETPASRSDDVTNQNNELAPGTIDVAQAIAIAEKFVHDNGYTDFRPDDPSKLTPESFEHEGRGNWLKQRFNTVRNKAIGYFKGTRYGSGGWTIGFERTNPANRNHGRAVTMGAQGDMLRMQHQDLLLNKLLPKPD